MHQGTDEVECSRDLTCPSQRTAVHLGYIRVLLAYTLGNPLVPLGYTSGPWVILEYTLGTPCVIHGYTLGH